MSGESNSYITNERCNDYEDEEDEEDEEEEDPDYTTMRIMSDKF